ncbi:anaerobic ribonucleoside-triphosphate reductase-activating protein [Vibrio diazotrophicus]|uniref:anaerobic ribonucleoside-triphosphate reductase-activating protein n=1 Tax=Vibrio diazotrophicus TaxID=685 RepID=UPI000C9DCBAF|nr:anaerobic ribonucleoside-triphosphate reductase-activating protein [Vibrio diazotrophicus]PNH83423.1 anaerobic ribonucleotide reductase-activating protein [Vibrio diazotrophicus]
MNYHQYHPIDVVNGPGTRCTLFVSGCEHNCKGCYNQSTWSLRSGHPYTQDLEDRIIADLNDTRIPKRGLSLSGGDPLHPQNVSAILHLVKRVKQECTDKDIWLWTGYLLSELSEAQKQVLEYIDVLIDGKFIKDLADPSLDWRGSSNQVIHYLKS